MRIRILFAISLVGLVCLTLVAGYFWSLHEFESLSVDSTLPPAEVTPQRTLFSFESPSELRRLSSRTNRAELNLVQDYGVTDGQNCARLTVPKTAEYGGFDLDPAAIANWNGYDYLAFDVYTEDTAEYHIAVELWDTQTRSFGTRCTWENVTTRAGHQTLRYPIHRACRNAKSGREWSELEALDKIDLNRLTRVRIFVAPVHDRDAVFWIDHLRLLTADAARPRLTLPVPKGAFAFNFGDTQATSPGFQQISENSIPSNNSTAGFLDHTDRISGGEGWPDLVSGTFVSTKEGAQLEFRAAVPDGDYHYWLIASPILRAEPLSFQFQLQFNDEIMANNQVTPVDYFSEHYLYRFLRTQFSQKPDALWNNYIQRMYPVRTGITKVTGGELRLSATNHFLSALVLVPIQMKAEFIDFVDSTEQLRCASFAKSMPLPATHSVAKTGLLKTFFFCPERTTHVGPATQPAADEINCDLIRTAGTPGERVIARFACRPTADLGECSVTLSDLIHSAKPSKSISADDARIYFQNQRFDGNRMTEMALIPQSTWSMEANLTQCCWIWWQIPPDSTAGIYRGTITLRPQSSPPLSLPLEIEVYPFTLSEPLPVSYGLYYTPRIVCGLPPSQQREIRRRQLMFMREIGLTSVPVGCPKVRKLRDDGTVELQFDPELFDLAKETGFGSAPEQFLMAQSLGMGRAIGRLLPGSFGPLVDQNPGIELKQPRFADYFSNAAQQYRGFLDQQGLPVAVEIVDEPRETPNPWNRNLADTLRYADLLQQAGVTTFMTPMSDQNNGLDYTGLVDHTDIISVHAWRQSQGLIARTRQRSKRLWFYNTGLDRFSWGFYPWARGAAGRWEWHYCWTEDRGQGGYPGRDGFNPFTGSHGLVPDGPVDLPIVFQPQLLDVADGITDLKYLHTLTVRIADLRKEERNSTVEKELLAGEQLLDRIRRTIPDFVEIRGLEDEAANALIGAGADHKHQIQAAEWRREIAAILKRLSAITSAH